MKYFRRLNEWKASNVVSNPATISAYSYGHWKFVSVIDGKVVFNNHRYSNTTRRHRAKVRKLMSELGIDIDLVMDTRVSLVTPKLALKDSNDALIKKAYALMAEAKMPKTKKAKNLERLITATELLKQANKLTQTFPEYCQ